MLIFSQGSSVANIKGTVATKMIEEWKKKCLSRQHCRLRKSPRGSGQQELTMSFCISVCSNGPTSYRVFLLFELDETQNSKEAKIELIIQIFHKVWAGHQ